MFYKKEFAVNTQKTAKVTVEDFSGGMDSRLNDMTSPFRYADLSYNFDLHKGNLEAAPGLKKLKLPTKTGGEREVKFPTGIYPRKIYHYKRYDYEKNCRTDRIMAFCKDGNIYEIPLYGDDALFTLVSGLSFANEPAGQCYKYNGDDVIIFSAENEKLKIYNGTAVIEADDAPNITSMCFHYERLFVTTGGESTSLWFSDDFDPTNWYVSLDEAGFIDLQDERGKLLKAVSFDDYLYVFRNYGITRITAYGDQSEFGVTNLFVSSGRIRSGSITVCGNRILFLAEDGFYKFDGVSTVRILGNYTDYIDFAESVKGLYYNGKAYFILNMFLNGNTQSERAMLVYDTESGGSYVIKDFKYADNELIEEDNYCKQTILIEDDASLYTFSENERETAPAFKVWKSKFSDFGIKNSNKLLYEVSVWIKGDAVLYIDNGEKVLKYSLHGRKSGPLVFKPMLKGDGFSYEIKSESKNVSIGKIVFTFKYY